MSAPAMFIPTDMPVADAQAEYDHWKQEYEALDDSDPSDLRLDYRNRLAEAKAQLEYSREVEAKRQRRLKKEADQKVAQIKQHRAKQKDTARLKIRMLTRRFQAEIIVAGAALLDEIGAAGHEYVSFTEPQDRAREHEWLERGFCEMPSALLFAWSRFPGIVTAHRFEPAAWNEEKTWPARFFRGKDADEIEPTDTETPPEVA